MNRNSSNPVRREDQRPRHGPPVTNGAERVDKTIYVYVNEMEYKAILKWDEDGGAPANIVYLIIPDEEFDGIAVKQAAA